MNLTRLQTFVEVARRGTFAAAADALSFTPSAVSQQMTKLEAEMGAALLLREATGVRLTEAGRLLHEHAVGIVDAVRAARAGLDALHAEQVKRLRIGACPIAACTVLPRALRLLRRRLPTAELLLEEAPAGAVREAVLDGRLQVGVWVTTAGADDDPRLAETVLQREPLYVALAADHPLARLDQLDEEALAATPRIGDGARWRVESPRTILGGRAVAERAHPAAAGPRAGVGAARRPPRERSSVGRHAGGEGRAPARERRPGGTADGGRRLGASDPAGARHLVLVLPSG